jgi:hypothetical protein
LRREFPKCNNFKELHSNQKHFPLASTVRIIKISEKERGLNAKNKEASFKVRSTLIGNKNAFVINTWALNFFFFSLVDGKKNLA